MRRAALWLGLAALLSCDTSGRTQNGTPTPTATAATDTPTAAISPTPGPAATQAPGALAMGWSEAKARVYREEVPCELGATDPIRWQYVATLGDAAAYQVYGEFSPEYHAVLEERGDPSENKWALLVKEATTVDKVTGNLIAGRCEDFDTVPTYSRIILVVTRFDPA